MTHTRFARGIALFAAAALTVAACGSDSDSGSEPSATAAPEETTAPTEAPDDTSAPEETTAPDTTEPETTDGGEEPAGSDQIDFRELEPATGEPMLIGMVNTEGVPGLDYPEFRTDTDVAIEYLNQHGGFGGRPVEVVHCKTSASPETSQACAQELAGKGVEFVMLGLDIFPGYDTFAASGIPVFGALPILPSDYTADALFLTGGNAATMAAVAALAIEHYGAESVGIISADNPGANGTEASLKGALDKAGVPYVSVKGGDNETDAGFQGLIREANKDNPDVLVSLYSDAGCIGAMRGRVSLGIETPMISTSVCASAEVLDVVGDDAIGWAFIPAGGPTDTPGALSWKDMVIPVHGDVQPSSLGMGSLAITQVMTLANVAHALAADGEEVTGQAMYDRLQTSRDLRTVPNDTLLECGLAPAYPAVCSFEFSMGEYVEGGQVVPIPGFTAFNIADYLP